MSRMVWPVALGALLASCARNPADAIPADADDIAGIVRSSQGAEAGVWVIAETTELPTRFTRSVVTDDAGRFVIPDLPPAKYQVWVRGYGLVDSAKAAVSPGQHVTLQASLAPDAKSAAKIYPAVYWYAMMKIPPASELEGTAPGGVDEYLGLMKNQACIGCHQIGDLATRTFPATLGPHANSQEGWLLRMQSGQAAFDMMRWTARMNLLNTKYLADWTDRVAAGELPAAKPERPRGLERNAVITTWDWADGKSYLHDLISTDRRNPRVNAGGKLYGSPEFSTDNFPVLDPQTHTATTFKAPVRDADTPAEDRIPNGAPSPYWGEERIWNSKANAHNPMMDGKGRVWYTARIRAEDTPAFCRKGSTHPSARLFPLDASLRQLAVYEPTTGKYTFLDTCFPTHHMAFAEDANDTAWVSGGTIANPVVGWINTKLFDETGDAARSQGWTALIVDTNGNGKRDAYTEPDQPLDIKKDRRLPQGFYAVMVSPLDGSVWGTVVQTYYPGAIVRLDPGKNPPATALAEVYNIPQPGFGPRGADVDRNGVVWVSLGSGHLGEFDRRKCKSRPSGADAMGNQCPEGWTFHPLPGPAFSNHPGFSAEASYYTWVDQHDAAGLGANVPIAMGNLSDSVVAFVKGQMVSITVPYPLGFYAKGIDGRIDDPDAGWKGRGLWTTYGSRTPAHLEGGKGSRPFAVHIQMRPDPLAH